MMLTPWFAAGAGIVVAAAVALDSPAALTYSPAGPGTHCQAGGCATAAIGAGYRLGYQIAGRRPGGFIAVITIPGEPRPGSWSLRFGFPAARVDRVRGAHWQPSGNGRAATATGAWQWRGHSRHGPDARRITVLASGTPSAPSRCRLDGITCSFG
jgi:hypothetical protein